MSSQTLLRLLVSCALLTSAPASLARTVDIGTPATADRDGSDRSYYLKMRDGTRLALNLYFPDHSPPLRPTPVVLVQTRYGRASEYFHTKQRDLHHFVEAGYVVAVVDTRGSTSSFGPRDVDVGADEVRDMDELITHLAKQPWSSGQVIATGFSYMADTADWAASRPAPALVATIPREADFDVYLNLFAPGGVENSFMLQGWGGYTREIDLGRSGDDRVLDCRRRASDCASMFPVLQPVDGDADYAQLRQALGGRKRWGPQDYAALDFRDDRTASGFSYFASSSASAIAAIRRQKKPAMYWGSWVDGGTALSALERYASAPNVPMQVWITANDHPHRTGSDPLTPEVKTPVPTQDAQFSRVLQFAQQVRSGKPVERAINYYVMGSERLARSVSWPPADTRAKVFAFAAGHSLATTLGDASGIDRYEVNFTATTGKATRWSTQFGGPPAYGDRSVEDEKLLHYDASPVQDDTEVVGTPVVTLQVATLTADPAFFVYLEDVAPDGRVTYLTEGEFRALNRKPAEPAKLPYDQGPAPHTFARADAAPMVPGRTAQVRFALFPTAALVRRGHHLRVAIAGGDAGIFKRYSEGKPERFDVAYGGARPSTITLNLRAAPRP